MALSIGDVSSLQACYHESFPPRMFCRIRYLTCVTGCTTYVSVVSIFFNIIVIQYYFKYLNGGGFSKPPKPVPDVTLLSCQLFALVGDQVKPLFSSFGLPAQTLSQIW